MKTKCLLYLILFQFFVSYGFGGEIHGKITVKQLSDSNTWVNASSRENVVVYVLGFEEPPLAKTVYLDQKNKSFVPEVLVITRHQRVIFRNQDPISHNVFSLSKAKKFDLGLYKAPVEKTLTFDHPGLVKVFCNIHNQMIANLLVLKNNKYALTGEDGKYQIQNIPAGNYKVRVWNEGSKLLSQKIKVTPSSLQTLDFEVQVHQRMLKHLNKHNKPYKNY